MVKLIRQGKYLCHRAENWHKDSGRLRSNVCYDAQKHVPGARIGCVPFSTHDVFNRAVMPNPSSYEMATVDLLARGKSMTDSATAVEVTR